MHMSDLNLEPTGTIDGPTLIDPAMRPVPAPAQDVERRVTHTDLIELAAPHAVDQRRALDQVITAERKDLSYRHAVELVSGAPHPL